MRHIRRLLPCLAALSTACAGGATWLRGNLHTHSFWSDGDQFPEVVLLWYRENGYDFVSLSDHNVLAEGERWLPLAGRPSREAAYAAYRLRFGNEVTTRLDSAGGTEVRLRTFDEYAGRLTTAGFLVIQAEEISDSYDRRPLHVNATNVRELVEPQHGASVRDVLQRNINEVLAQRERTGQVMVPHVNHPNYGWAVTVEDLMALEGERFFEVYNGHPAVHNDGDSLRPSTDRMWDIILATRLTRGRTPMFGIAVDDAHHYGGDAPTRANPGRGWVMVRAGQRSAEAILEAMERGDFYASTGVRLSDVRTDGTGISLAIRGEPGVRYVTEFVGTRRGYDTATTRVADVAGLPASRIYSRDIGAVLAEVAGTRPAYRFRGDELYVRARVRSTRVMANPVIPGEVERAWTQPVTP